MAKAIKVESLSKAYQLGDFGTGTISRDLERFWARMRGKEDPFLKIGEINDRTTKGESDIVWSLNDINFEIEQGDAVGIIGRNGAGKSTLLKILSRVTTPTKGSVKVKGRIASLLEVGTGFHPELTGRENIYLNGAILGMRKKEIKRKFDEIVDFAGVERYIDTPVKRYSSGMYVRLAFAVAAHLESEILIVDEVLAVGDAEFQKKCLGKMNDVSKGEGRTVLFVSHNMGSVMQLCNKGILLHNSEIIFKGDINNTINEYARLSQYNRSNSFEKYLENLKNNVITISEIKINDSDNFTVDIKDQKINFEFSGYSFIDDKVDIEIHILNSAGVGLFFSSLYYTQGINLNIQVGKFKVEFSMLLPENITSGDYNMNINVTKPGNAYIYKMENVVKLNIMGSSCESGKVYNNNEINIYCIMSIEDYSYKNTI